MNTSWLSYFDDPKSGLTPEQLDELARRIGFALPHSLRVLYGTLGGGRFHFGLFVDADDVYYDVAELIPTTSTELDGRLIAEGVVETYAYIVQERGLVPEHLLPFAVESGGNFYCVDRRDESVWYADMELGNDGQLPAPTRIADSLDAFLRAGQPRE